MTASRTADLNDAAAFAAARKRLDESPAVPGTVRVHVMDDVVTLTGVSSGDLSAPARSAQFVR